MRLGADWPGRGSEDIRHAQLLPCSLVCSWLAYGAVVLRRECLLFNGEFS